ncbi:MAG: glycosyltransferase [Balneolaceae bacterium]|nr:MAG: glycosyltransferase [Balneolaceae bacterium]
MPKQKISVIIPVFNEAEILGSTLQQLKQKHRGSVDEILIVDGGSTDNTVQIAAESGAKVLHSKNKGRAAQMNLGARMAKGEVLFFLHADTLPPAGFDRHIINSLEDGADFGSFMLRFDWDHPLLNLYSWFTQFKTPLIRFGDQGLYARRENFLHAGCFDERLTVMEDQKIVYQLRKTGRFGLITKEVITSARKYRSNGVVRLQLIFFAIWLGYYLGISQDVLVHFYRSQLSR